MDKIFLLKLEGVRIWCPIAVWVVIVFLGQVSVLGNAVAAASLRVFLLVILSDIGCFSVKRGILSKWGSR